MKEREQPKHRIYLKPRHEQEGFFSMLNWITYYLFFFSISSLPVVFFTKDIFASEVHMQYILIKFSMLKSPALDFVKL